MRDHIKETLKEYKNSKIYNIETSPNTYPIKLNRLLKLINKTKLTQAKRPKSQVPCMPPNIYYIKQEKKHKTTKKSNIK